MKKLYDPVKEVPLGPGTQLKPTAEQPRPLLRDTFEAQNIVDHKGGSLKQIRPQKNPNKGEEI